MSSVVLSVNDKLQKQLIDLTGGDAVLRDRLIARFNTAILNHLEQQDSSENREEELARVGKDAGALQPSESTANTNTLDLSSIS